MRPFKSIYFMKKSNGTRTDLRAIAVVAALLSGIPAGQALAHHSFAAYDVSKTLTIEGTVEEFQMRNPHSLLQVFVKDANGATKTWTVECPALTGLSNEARSNGPKAGEKVVVVGNPGRDEASSRLRMVQISRPSDGWKWSEIGR